MKISKRVTELSGVQDLFWETCKKNSKRGITPKLKKGEQSFVYVTHCLDLIHIPIKFHEEIPISYRVIGCTRM